MKKQQYEIDKNGMKVVVEGYVFNKIWGVDKRDQQHYVLTHIPTGYLVESAKTLKFLKELLADPVFAKEELDVKGVARAIKRKREEGGGMGWLK